MSNKLSFNRGIAYSGTNAIQPPECHFEQRDPTQYDTQSVSLLDLWLNEKSQSVWVLVSLAGDSNSRGTLATWINLAEDSGLQTLTSNSGGPVGLDGAHNIFLVGDGITITGVGNPATHTITFSTSGTGVLSTLTGNTGGAVSPLAGNVNIVGDGVTATVTGVPGTHTLTISVLGGQAADSFQTDVGTAAPIAGVMSFRANTQSGSSVFFTGATNVVTLSVTDANTNTIIGHSAGNNTLAGTVNVGLGFNVLHSATSAFGNTVVGNNALSSLLTGSNNVALGAGAGSALVGAESSNVYLSSPGIVSESHIVRLGTDGSSAGQQNTTYMAGNVNMPHSLFMNEINGSNAGTAKISFAPAALAQPTNDIYFYLNNIFIGQGAGNQTMTPSVAIFNTGVGHFSLESLTTGTQNDCIGNATMQNATTASNNVAIGYTTLQACTSGSKNVGVGSTVLQALTSGSFNTVVGEESASLLSTGSSNTVIGQQSFISATTAQQNFIGADQCCEVMTTGTENVIIGPGAARYMTTGSSNVALGWGVFTDGVANLGPISGSFNISLGVSVGSAGRGGESNNIYLNSPGVAAESNVLRIGAATGGGQQQLSAAFIAGIRGVTTGVNNAIAVVIDSNGQLGTTSSTRKLKDSIRPMGDESSALMKLKPSIFTWKKDPLKQKQYGLIAEEVAEVFQELVISDDAGDPYTVRYMDLPVLLLNELQKQAKLVEELSNKLALLESRTKIH